MQHDADCVTLCLVCLALGAIRHVTMLAHASWLAAPGRPHRRLNHPCHGTAVRAGVTMLGLFSCLVLALPGLTMALGVGVGVGVGVGPLVSLLLGA